MVVIEEPVEPSRESYFLSVILSSLAKKWE